jgi:hypothetical protein
MTTEASRPMRSSENGRYIYPFPADAVLEAEVLAYGTGRLRVCLDAMVSGALINRAVIDLLNQDERYRYVQRAKDRAPSVDWDSALLYAQNELLNWLKIQASAPSQDDVGPGACIALDDPLLTFKDMLTLAIPERQRHLPWLPERGLAMVYGPRGIGKTQFLLGIGIHLAAGQDFLGWNIPGPIGVLYVDGEMALDELRERAVLLSSACVPESLYFLNGEMVYTKLGRDLVLTGEPMRQAVDRLLDAHPGIRVVIFDNVSCLFSGISEDRKQDWEPINAWMVRLRHRGLSVVLGHHAGKGGQQRGTSGREDALDTVIALEWPPDYDATEGCHFHLRFTKARSVRGDVVKALDVRLGENGTGVLTWDTHALDESRREQVRRLLEEGAMSQSEIAEHLGLSKGRVSQLRKQIEQGA